MSNKTDGTDSRTDALRSMVMPRSAASAVGAADADDATGTAVAAPGRPDRDRYDLPDRPEPPPVPNGWYSICSSDDLVSENIISTIAVERELVVYRDESGGAHVADAHCPHLGAHLGGGRVVGDTLKCPYHGWSFDAESGECVDIPYSDARIPSKACLRTYRVCEQDGFVFFWYHAGDREPAYEIPRASEPDDPDWSEAYVWNYELLAALPEMAENNVDYAHLRYVHRRPYVPDETSKFTTDGPFSTVIEQLPDGQEFYRHTWGPGIAILLVPDLMTVITATTPIDRRHCRLNWHFHFKGDVEKMSEELIEGVTGTYGLMADVPIWRDKVFFDRPVLVKADGNIAEFRSWYSQFYGTD